MNKVDLLVYSNLHKIFKPFYAGCGHVLVFHRICYDNTVFHKNLQMTPEYLEEVIKYFISNKIDIVTLNECYKRITTKGRVNRFVVFTFDDGYADTFTHALPVFEKHKAPFEVFLTTGFPDKKLVFWGYLLESLIIRNEKIKFSDGEKVVHYNTRTIVEKRVAFYKIRKYLRESKQESILSRLITIFNLKPEDLQEETAKLMLSWEQVVELSNHPLAAIGAHTVNHPILSNLSEKEVISEVIDSVKIIERRIGKPVPYFAYPFGGDQEASLREYHITRNCEIKMAFTAKNGNIFKHHAQHLTSLPRIGLNENWSMANLDLFINGFTPFFSKFR